VSDHNRSVFKIMDGMVEQINKIKKIFIILLVVIIIPPVILEIVVAVFGLNFESLHHDENRNNQRNYIHVKFFHDIFFFMFVLIVLMNAKICKLMMVIVMITK